MSAKIRLDREFYATRASAKALRAAFEPALQAGQVVLDFTGVVAITNAWADELLGTLPSDQVEIRNANEAIADTIALVRARRTAR